MTTIPAGPGVQVAPNSNIIIMAPVTNSSTVSARVKVYFKITQSALSPFPGTDTGDFISDFLSTEQTIPVGGSAEFYYNTVATIKSGQKDRDLYLQVRYFDGVTWANGTDKKVYPFFEVTPGVYQFTIGTPTVRQV